MQADAVSVDLPAAVDERVAALSRTDRIQHDRNRAAGGILHTAGALHAAGGKTVLLILNGTRAYCDIAEYIGQIAVVLGIQHFISAHKTGLLNGACVQLAHVDKTLKHVLALGGVWLVDHSLVALAGGSGLVGVDSRDNNDLVLDLLLKSGKAAGVVHY